MIEDVYDPLERYAREFALKFSQVVDETFEQLEQLSGVDRSANQKLCFEIKKQEGLKTKQESKVSFMRSLRICLIIAIIGILGFIGFSYYTQKIISVWHIVGSIGVISLISIVFAFVNPMIRDLDERIRNYEVLIERLTHKAWDQMKPLNDLYDWSLTTSMIQQVIPKLEFDSFLHQDRLAELINDYDLLDLPDNQSVVAAQSGEINSNPFILAQILCQEWETKTYYGSIMITWRETVRGPDGKIVCIQRCQTLTASVNAPAPLYTNHNCLIYGNDAAPNLSFYRTPSEHSGDNGGWFANYRKNKDLKRLTKFSQKLDDDSQYTLMANKEFELLFKTTNRDNEKEYRMLFTPLAQKQMLDLINDTKIGYGDDFSFRKQNKINIITANHLDSQPLDTSPARYYDYDIARAEATFKRFNNAYFKSIYFAFAPLLAIPIYQQIRPLRKIYGSHKMQSSNWELESLANHYGDAFFKSNKIETPCILKAQMAKRYGRDGMAVITAHGFYTEKRVTTVPMLGGDGKIHVVPVEWLEYFPISNTSSILVREYEDREFADENQTVANEFCDVLNKFAGKDVLARRNILSGIMRNQ